MLHIFVGYSHLDRRWIDRKNPHNLIPFLAASLAREDVELWYDPALIAGELFRPTIEAQIDTAEIAILLLSQDFFNSDFIRDVELPRIEARANAGGLQIIPILVGNCDWEEMAVVGSRHILPGGPTPLIDFVGRDADWDRVRHEILQAVRRQLARLRTNPPQGTEPPDIALSGVRTAGLASDHGPVRPTRSSGPSPTVPVAAIPQGSGAVHGTSSGPLIDHTPGFEPGDTPRSPERPTTRHPDDGRINLLAAANGGQVLVGSSDEALKLLSGQDAEFYGPFEPGEGGNWGEWEQILAFKDEQFATFDTFSVLIPNTAEKNIKEFELLVNDESPSASFRSIGKFETKNVKLFQTKGYQDFTFPPVTAKYLKIRFLSNYGAWGHWTSTTNGLRIVVHELRLFGRLGR